MGGSPGMIRIIYGIQPAESILLCMSLSLQEVTNTHVKRWKEHRHEIGFGHLYQGRYKCFPVETEDYFYQVVRYVERNALRANLVERAESWRWSSLRRVEREDPAFPIL